VPYNLGIVVQPYAIPICIMGNHWGSRIVPAKAINYYYDYSLSSALLFIWIGIAVPFNRVFFNLTKI